MYYFFIATNPSKQTQYAIVTDSGWYGWHTNLNKLLTTAIKNKKSTIVLQNDNESFTEFYVDLCNSNQEYTINYSIIGNKLDDLQTTHPELFI